MEIRKHSNIAAPNNVLNPISGSRLKRVRNTLDGKMKQRITILLVACLAGCGTPPPKLVQLDEARVLEIAQREIEAKCPEFPMETYEPAWVYYHAGVDPRTEGTISVTYLSREPTDIRDWKSLTNGPARVASTYRSAQVNLSEQGELQKQNVGEWSEFPEWVFIRHSEVTRVKPKERELSNQEMHRTK